MGTSGLVLVVMVLGTLLGPGTTGPRYRSLVGDRLGSGVSGSVALAAGSRMRNVVTGALRSLLCSAGVW